MDDARARFLKAAPVTLTGDMEKVQKYLVKVQDIPQRVQHMGEAMAHMSGSVKEGREQTKAALASATSAQEIVPHMESNITSFKTTLTEAAQGYQTMRREPVKVENREHEDIMACVGGIQEPKDIALRVTGEAKGL